jgi:hypothetical protein
VPSLSSRFLLLHLRPENRERGTVAKVIERVQAHYEVEDVEMGKVYTWRPQSVVVQCEECVEKPDPHGLQARL